MNNEKNEIPSNLLSCSFERNENNVMLSFSLMDYLNNLFTSKNPDDVLRFYDYFGNEEQLVKWMKERPKGSSRIVEFEGNKEIVVVIPTMDVNGEFANRCREEIFKNFHLIFVESGIGNYYFNYAHNCNIGLKKALEYNPKWVILSNDDMYKIDDSEVLVKELKKINNDIVKNVFIKPTDYHSSNVYIFKKKFYIVLLKFLIDLFGPLIKHNFSEVKFNTKMNLLLFYYRKYLKYEMSIPEKFLLGKIISKLIRDKHYFINVGSFSIFSGRWVMENHGKIFDENYQNGFEDFDISLYLDIIPNKLNYINYSIGDLVGSSIGMGKFRTIKDFLKFIYFNKKWGEILNEFIG